jgi:hypothetical protein
MTSAIVLLITLTKTLFPNQRCSDYLACTRRVLPLWLDCYHSRHKYSDVAYKQYKCVAKTAVRLNLRGLSGSWHLVNFFLHKRQVVEDSVVSTVIIMSSFLSVVTSRTVTPGSANGSSIFTGISSQSYQLSVIFRSEKKV